MALSAKLFLCASFIAVGVAAASTDVPTTAIAIERDLTTASSEISTYSSALTTFIGANQPSSQEPALHADAVRVIQSLNLTTSDVEATGAIGGVISDNILQSATLIETALSSICHTILDAIILPLTPAPIPLPTAGPNQPRIIPINGKPGTASLPSPIRPIGGPVGPILPVGAALISPQQDAPLLQQTFDRVLSALLSLSAESGNVTLSQEFAALQTHFDSVGCGAFVHKAHTL